jgi:hypothetical protein
MPEVIGLSPETKTVFTEEDVILKLLEDTGPRAPARAANWYAPVVVILKSLNMATPLALVFTVVVPFNWVVVVTDTAADGTKLL